jgi:hypothetical protein
LISSSSVARITGVSHWHLAIREVLRTMKQTTRTKEEYLSLLEEAPKNILKFKYQCLKVGKEKSTKVIFFDL